MGLMVVLPEGYPACRALGHLWRLFFGVIAACERVGCAATICLG